MAATRDRHLRDIYISYFRPKERPTMVRVVDEKTKQESWIPLIDDAGSPIYPELMAELEAIKRQRIGGLMLCRDWGERGPWPTWPKPDQPDFTHLWVYGVGIVALKFEYLGAALVLFGIAGF